MKNTKTKKAKTTAKETKSRTEVRIELEQAIKAYNECKSKENCIQFVDALMGWASTGGRLLVSTESPALKVSQLCNKDLVYNAYTKERCFVPALLEVHEWKETWMLGYTSIKEAGRKPGPDLMPSFLGEVYELMRESEDITGIILNLWGSPCYITKELLQALYKNAEIK